MAVLKYRLKGHESFIPREGWLTKGLSAVNRDPQLFSVAAGADALGVGTNMAKSIRFWLKTAGLMKESTAYGATLTDLGRAIYENDPYLEDIFSLWILHINIVSNFSQATSWNVFFNSMTVTSFKREEMIATMTDLLYEKTREEKLSDRSIRDDCTAILSMYAVDREKTKDPEDKKDSPFTALGLIYPEGRLYERRQPDASTVDPMVIMFILSRVFSGQKDKSSVKSILIDDIINSDNMPGKIMDMNRIMINDCLDKLQDLGYIIVNRTAGLDIVYQNKEISPEQVVLDYYNRSLS